MYDFCQQSVALHLTESSDTKNIQGATCVDPMNIETTMHKNLEDAFAVVLQKIKPGDIVLLSPGGASYDLFENFVERGNAFKALVENYQNLT